MTKQTYKDERMKRHILFSGLLTLVAMCPANAETPSQMSEYSKTYATCMEKAVSTIDMVE